MHYPDVQERLSVERYRPVEALFLRAGFLEKQPDISVRIGAEDSVMADDIRIGVTTDTSQAGFGEFDRGGIKAQKNVSGCYNDLSSPGREGRQ